MDACMFLNVYHIAWILPWIIFHTSAQPTVVTLSVPSGTEGSHLTLTCQSSEDVHVFLWFSITYQTYVAIIHNFINNQSCMPHVPRDAPNPTLYSYSCPNRTTHTLTFMNVTSSNHGEIWVCDVMQFVTITSSNNVTISVQVPVTSVVLSPSTDVTTLNVSQPATFECTVPRSLPNATIVWYKNSSGVISDLTHFASVISTPNPDRTVRTSGRLIFTPNTTDSGVGLYCTASSGGTGMTSQQTRLHVQFPVTSVELSPPTDVTTINVSQSATFECTVPRSLPSATIVWYKNSSGVISNPIPSSSSQISPYSDGTVTTTGILIFSPSKEDNGVGMYCTASSGGASRTSRQIIFNVQFPPDGPPRIENFSANSDFFAIRATQQTLTCSVTGGNPLATLTWNNCYNGTLDSPSSVSGTVSSRISWVASSSEQTCTCTSSHPLAGTRSTALNIKILYPPTTPKYDVGSTMALQSGTIKVVKGTNTDIRCSSTSNPTPNTWRWTRPSGSTDGQTLSLKNIQTSDQGTYSCEVKNTMVTSRNETVIGYSNSSIYIDVLYSPTTPIFRYGNFTGPLVPTGMLVVFKGDPLILACQSQANPPPSYSWPGQIWTGTPQSNTSQTCKVSNIMEATGKATVLGSNEASVTITALEPPSVPTLASQTCQSTAFNTGSTINVNVGRSVTVTCSSTAVPSPIYIWSMYQSTQHNVLSINSVSRDDARSYICDARNYMNTTFTGMREGHQNSSFRINTQYPPEVHAISNLTVPEHENVTVLCSVTQGNPPSITYTWSRRDGYINAVITSAQMRIQDISRNASDFYTCTASNTLNPTGCPQEHGIDSREFYIDVQYKSTIDRFGIVGNMGISDITVNENVSSTLSCYVDSNPGSTITLLKDGIRIKRTENSHQLQSTLRNDCSDSGVYTCSSVNIHNTYGESVRNINYHVKCAPRRSPNRDILSNVSIDQNENVTLVFYTLAYPSPQFTWQKCALTCINITDEIKYQIFSDDLVSNLTVLDIQQSDYGSYRVVVSNTIGTAWIENYNILRPAKPSVPSYFLYTQHSQLQTSVSFYWLPGYNGGFVQTFVIEYRKTGSQVWDKISVDEDTSKLLMNATIDNLSTGTEYQARMFARNEFGASDHTETVSFAIQACTSITSATHQELSQVGFIVGGILSGVLLVAFIAVLIYLRLTNRIGYTKKGKERNEAIYEDVSNSNTITNHVYEGLSSVSTSTDVYSSIQDTTSPDNRLAQKKCTRDK